MSKNDYDIVPYDSYPYPNTHPENLYTIGSLFGLKSAAPKKCRVLELGCASGGNIIPMAIKFPNSQFVGVDLSKVQIDEGNNHIEKLNIKNLSLKNISIMDVNKDFGKFDYIIAHGVFSWVPKDVQDKILQICNDNLNANGIAYVSYNTLPGWNMVKGIREMMLYHTNRFSDPAQKVFEARQLLEFIKNGNTNNSIYSEVIQNEINSLKDIGDSYLIHDYLEENNEQFYFHDFMEKAQNTGLQYLGDSYLASMFAGNFPKETADILMQVSGDAVRAEQYMDFVTNRRFRSTLLCHSEVKLHRNLTGESIRDFYLSPFLKPEKDPKDIDLTLSENVVFSSKTGFTFTTNNHAVIAALLYMAESNEPIAVKNILAEVKKRMGSAANFEVIEKVVLENLLRLVLADMPISSLAVDYAKKVSNKPKASELARYQATYAGWVTNQKSARVGIDLFGRVVCQYMDGETDFESIVSKMVDHVVSNDLALHTEEGPITGKDEIEKSVRIVTKNIIDSFVPNALLVA
jgi:methyltransferase-like protein